MRELEGKVAFLTGGGRGVGVGIARALAKAGASVGLMGRTRATLEETAGIVESLGSRALVCVGDVGLRQDVDEAVAKVTAELGPIWALVNNAYAATTTPVEGVTDETLMEALRSCVFGSLYTMQACFPTMRERGGRIVNFGSGAATMGGYGLASYNIAKEALRGLTKVAAVNWWRYGITVNTVCPLATSEANTRWFNSLDEAGKQKHLETIPLRRMGDPESDIGGIVVYLAGNAGRYITSRTLHADGGAYYYDR